MFVDLGAESQFIGVEKEDCQIAIEIKELRGRSVIAELEQAIGQYVLYQLLLTQVDPDLNLDLAITTQTYENLFQEPIGQLVLQDLPLRLLVVDIAAQEVCQTVSFKLRKICMN